MCYNIPVKPPDIEALLTKESRLKDGIFFTPGETVAMILDRLPGSGIGTVIDSAAGSGNFLMAAARKWPGARLWGIEKNPEVYRLAAPALARFPQITWLGGDCLTETFDIPPCDLYLGNPPFINHTDLDPDYREQIRPLWRDSGLAGSGFSLLLGNSRADLASLIFHETIRKYLKQDGRFGVILPLSLLSGGGANAPFHRLAGLRAEYMENLTGSTRFRNAVHPAFYIEGIKGGETVFPVRAGGFPGSTWSPEPMARAGFYKARQGINTLGANKVFFFDGEPPFESRLTRPLYRGTDPCLWGGEPTGSVLFPYRDDGTLIPENELEGQYPKAWQWLLNHREILERRISRHTRGRWYSLFGVGPYTGTPWKVIWRAMGQNRIRASVSGRGLANQALHGYIPAGLEREAGYLAAVLNSEACHRILSARTRPGSLSFGQPGTVSNLPLPRFDPDDPLMAALADEGSGCSLRKESSVPEIINRLAEELLGR
jgi:hypothetical protein